MRTTPLALTLLLLLGVAGANALGSLDPSPVYATGTPCDNITGDPNPPIGIPEPYISGSVVNASTSAGISGLPVKLYRCDNSTATLVATQTTGSPGSFSFTDLDYPYWYYVQVDTSNAPGLDPVSPTVNPTSLIEVGNGIAALTFTFD